MSFIEFFVNIYNALLGDEEAGLSINVGKKWPDTSFSLDCISAKVDIQGLSVYAIIRQVVHESYMLIEWILFQSVYRSVLNIQRIKIVLLFA